MYRAREYAFPVSGEEALRRLREDAGAAVVAGNTWLRLGRREYSVLLDLERLGLDVIQAENGRLHLGAMVPMEELRRHPVCREAFGGLLGESVKSIVGVQFRNQATLGPSVYHRYGFSDLLTALAVLDCRVELLGAGEMSLAEWMAPVRRERDILTGLSLGLDGRVGAFCSQRNTATDFAVLHAAASRTPAGTYALAVGARPGAARRCPQAEAALESGASFREAAALAAGELTFGDDLRGSAAYRAVLAEVLVRRALEALEGKEG